MDALALLFELDSQGQTGTHATALLSKAVKDAGGTVAENAAGRHTHVVRPRAQHHGGAQLVGGTQECSVLWVLACLEAKEVLPVGAHPAYRPAGPVAAPAGGAPAPEVCVTGFAGARRAAAVSLLQSLGVRTNLSFNPKCPPDLLLAEDVGAESAKTAAARSISVPVVSLLWLLESLAALEVRPALPAYKAAGPVQLVFKGPAAGADEGDGHDILQDSQPQTSAGGGLVEDSAPGGDGDAAGGGRPASASPPSQPSRRLASAGSGPSGVGVGSGGQAQAMARVGGMADALFGETQVTGSDLPPPPPRLMQLPPPAPPPRSGSSTPSGLSRDLQKEGTAVVDEEEGAIEEEARRGEPAPAPAPAPATLLQTQVLLPPEAGGGGDDAEAQLFGQSDVDAFRRADEGAGGGAGFEEADGGGAEEPAAPPDAAKQAAERAAAAVNKRSASPAEREKPRKQRGPLRAPFSQPLPEAAAPAAAEAAAKRKQAGKRGRPRKNASPDAEAARPKDPAAAGAGGGTVKAAAEPEPSAPKRGRRAGKQEMVAPSDPPPAAEPAPEPAAKRARRDVAAPPPPPPAAAAKPAKRPAKPAAAKPKPKPKANPPAAAAKKAAAAAAPCGPQAEAVRVALSGFHTDQLQVLSSKVKALGVRCAPAGHSWKPGTTHVVAPELTRNQKCLSALSAGAWLVGPRWADGAAGGLSAEEPHELSSGAGVERGAAAHWRRRAAATGAGAFAGLRFAVARALDSPPSREDICAIIKAGGGEVVPLTQAADVVLVAAAAAATTSAVALQVRDGAAAAAALYVVDWLSNPSAPLEGHLLLRSKPGARLAAAERARGAAADGGDGGDSEKSISM